LPANVPRLCLPDCLLLLCLPYSAMSLTLSLILFPALFPILFPLCLKLCP
jgi:hypothetical protein